MKYSGNSGIKTSNTGLKQLFKKSWTDWWWSQVSIKFSQENRWVFSKHLGELKSHLLPQITMRLEDTVEEPGPMYTRWRQSVQIFRMGGLATPWMWSWPTIWWTDAIFLLACSSCLFHPFQCSVIMWWHLRMLSVQQASNSSTLPTPRWGNITGIFFFHNRLE